MDGSGCIVNRSGYTDRMPSKAPLVDRFRSHLASLKPGLYENSRIAARLGVSNNVAAVYLHRYGKAFGLTKEVRGAWRKNGAAK